MIGGQSSAFPSLLPALQMGLAIHPETGNTVVANRLADSVTFLDLEAILNSAPGVSAAPAAKPLAPVVP